MCVQAGYIGEEPAAPILLEMLEREEGFWGGYYTGIATIHNGKLHYRKVVGDVAALRRQTDAEKLPGTVGIAHSRTPSGGDVEWGHPFLGCNKQLAYVAMGSTGLFKSTRDAASAGDVLLAKGHDFRSASDEKVGSYPVLSDGKCVHTSELMCHAVGQALADGCDLVEAMRRVYMQLPAEIAGQALHQDDPDRLAAACVNQALVIGRDATGCYVATTGIAFPGTVTWRIPMPANAAVGIRRERLEVRPFGRTFRAVNRRVSLAEIERRMAEHIREHPGTTCPSAIGACKAAWSGGGLCRSALHGFDALERLCRAGHVRFETAWKKGMFGKGRAPVTRIYWTE